MTRTTGRRVRIESTPKGRPFAQHDTRVYIDDVEVTNNVTAVDWHADPHGMPTAVLTFLDAGITAEAHEAKPQPEPDPVPVLLCAGCLIDQHTGARTSDPNPAIVIVGGTSSCREHLAIQTGPALPDRTPSGILLPGQAGPIPPLNGQGG